MAVAGDASAPGGFRAFLLDDAVEAIERLAGAADRW